MRRRFIKTSKKAIASLMVAAMIFTSAVVLKPIEANATVYENATEIDCSGWWVAHTGGYAVDETGVQITFDFKTYENTDSFTASNWHAPLVVVYSSDDGLVGGGNYTEYEVMRSDMYGWIGALNSGEKYSDWYAAGHRKYELFNPDWWTENSYNGANDFTWANWLADNQTGNAPGSVIAVREGNYVQVRMDINGVPTVWDVPVPADKDIYVALTGEYCTISNIQSKAFSGDYVYNPAWWSGKTQGYAVGDDGLRLTFDTKTDAGATANHETSGLVVFTGDNNYVNGANYYEYGFIRADLYGWGTNDTSFSLVATQTPNWDDYLAAHKAGATGEVEAYIEGDNLIVVYENAGAISTTTIGIDTTKEVYIAVTGQNSTASNVMAADRDTAEEVLEIIGAQTQETDSTYSLGFVTTIDKTTFDSMKEDIVEMGVLLKNDVTATSLALMEVNVGDYVKKVTTSYVTDLSNLDSTQTDDSVYAFRSIVTGVSALYKNYTAVPYITYMDGEEEVTVYGDALTRCIHDCK